MKQASAQNFSNVTQPSLETWAHRRHSDIVSFVGSFLSSVVTLLVFASKRPECDHSFKDCLAGGAVVTNLHPTVLYTCCCDCCLSSCVTDAVTVAVVVVAFVGFVEAIFYRVLFTSIKLHDEYPSSVRRRCLARPNVCRSVGIFTLTLSLF